MIRLFKIASALLIAIGLLQTCSDSGKDPIVEETPVIELIHINLNWNLADTSYNKVEAKIVDPQGVENIDSVMITILNPGGQVVMVDRLHDDGAYNHPNDGDVIAGDGVFSNRFNAASDIGSTVGDYLVEIQAFDFDGNQSDISDTTIHFGYSYTVEFVDIQKPDTLKSGAEAEYIYVALMHPEGLSSIENVSFNLYAHNSTALLETIEMFNDGDFNNSGDLIAADSVFSFKMDSTFAAGYKGLYDIEFTVTDAFGSVTKSVKFYLFLENEVAGIVELSVPDQMTRPTVPNTIVRELITAKIADPQGLGDIDSVYFYLKKPDGAFANSGNAFILVDNGKPFNLQTWYENAGDVTADDGIYSLSIFFYNTNDAGEYELSFYVRDKSGNLSEVLIDTLEVL
ncbi:MAG: hypothetical protein JW956_00660 [Calditrichaceae bacterium]|nr:hypothetical protein [Calditrichaceae bacterium]